MSWAMYQAGGDRAPPADSFSMHAVGHVRSALTQCRDAPRQGVEGAPDAWLEITPACLHALHGIAPGDDLIVITWLHLADRTVQQVHPRDDVNTPLTGVFATRSPDRPNPLGLHRVHVHECAGLRLRVGPLEAIDGTPIVDIKVVLPGMDEA